MEVVFHQVKIDKAELQRVKEASKKAKSKPKGLVETDDFIPFTFSESEKEEETTDVDLVEKEKKKPKSSGKPAEKPSAPRDKLPAKRARIDTLLYQDMPWMKKADRKFSSNPAERLHQEIVEFINWMGPTEEERYARALCVQKVKDLVAETWPEAAVETFGSVRTQFYVPSSDIDLVVMLPDSDSDSKPPLRKFAGLLKQKDIPERDSMQVISKARVPIIKYIDRVTAYPVDISFNVTSGTESGDLVTKYSGMYPALRPLTLLLKHFLEMRGLNEVYTGGIGSYTCTCLVLSFLQTHPLAQSGIIRPHENLGVMLLEILELYGKHFNYEQVGIAVNPVVEGEFYFDKIERGWVNEQRPGVLSLEDPQNRENDISKGSFSFYMVRQALEHGHSVLVSALAEFESALLDRHKPSKVDTSRISILASIIRLSDKLLRHRHYVQDTMKI